MKRIHLHGRLNDRQKYTCGNPGCYNRGSSDLRYGSGKMRNTIIRRGRILLGGLLAEVALTLAIVPLGLGLGDNSLALHCSPRILRSARRQANRHSQSPATRLFRSPSAARRFDASASARRESPWHERAPAVVANFVDGA